jgi:hypothetical protein
MPKFSLMQGFYSMYYTLPAVQGTDIITHHFVESTHNTRNPTTKVILVQCCYYSEAVHLLSAMHSILLTNVHEQYQKDIFVEGKLAGIVGQQVDTILSSHCAKMADDLLQAFDPQDGDSNAPSH